MKTIQAILLTIGLFTCPFHATAGDASAAATVKAPITKLDDSGTAKPVPPTKPENSNASTDIKNIIQNFEQAREALLANQKALQTSLKNASDDERDKIRDQLKQAKDALASQREQFRDQLKEVKDKLIDQNRKLKDEVADATKKGGKPRGD